VLVGAGAWDERRLKSGTLDHLGVRAEKAHWAAGERAVAAGESSSMVCVNALFVKREHR